MGQACIGGKCPPPGKECDDGNAVEWDGCTGGTITEFQVNTYTVNSQRVADVAVLSNGDFVVAWESMNQDGSVLGVYGKVFEPAATEGEEFQVNTYTNSHQDSAAVAALQGVGFVVVWGSYGQDGSEGGVFGQRFNSNGVSVGSEFQVNTFTYYQQYYADVSSLPGGGFVVAWQSGYSDSVYPKKTQDGSGRGVYAQRFNSQGQKQGGEFLVNTTTIHDQNTPSVGGSWSHDKFIVAWSSNAVLSSQFDVYRQLFASSGGKASAESLVNSYSNNVQTNSSVAISTGGDVVLAWESNGQDGDGGGVFCQRYKSDGGKLGSNFQVNSYSTGTQGRPAVAFNGEARFVVAWDGAGLGDALGVYVQRFEDTNTKVGSESLVHDYTSGSQFFASAAGFDGGDFVVVWESDDQDGDKRGVFAQRFNKDGTKLYR